MSNPEENNPAQIGQTADAPLLVRRDGHVMIITINRPGARNAVNMAVSAGIGLAIEEAQQDPDVRAVILTGTGDIAFCAGGDLKEVASGDWKRPDGQGEWGFAGLTTHHIDKPIIAAVNGLALGGGLELVLVCDLAVAAENARFGLPEVKRGIYPGAGGAFRLPAQLPQKIALEMVLTGDPISAPRAFELGLVNAVVPQADVLEAALRLAARITVNAPLSVQLSKRLAKGIRDGRVAHESAAWEMSEEIGRRLALSEDAKEGPRAFAEKREPVWKGR